MYKRTSSSWLRPSLHSHWRTGLEAQITGVRLGGARLLVVWEALVFLSSGRRSTFRDLGGGALAGRRRGRLTGHQCEIAHFLLYLTVCNDLSYYTRILQKEGGNISKLFEFKKLRVVWKSEHLAIIYVIRRNFECTNNTFPKICRRSAKK